MLLQNQPENRPVESKRFLRTGKEKCMAEYTLNELIELGLIEDSEGEWFDEEG